MRKIKENKKIKELRQNSKGITLVALVITIVILIILATVSINVLLGEGGLINQAKKAKEMTTNSSIAEQEQLNELLGWTTNSIEGGSEVEPPVIEGVITINPAEWQGDGTARVTISSNKEEYKIEYRVDKSEGNDVEWTEIQNGETISSLKHGDVVFARLTDGSNYGDEASVNILDGTEPSVSVTLRTVTENSIEVNVSASDGESGLADTNTYKYYTNDILKHTGTETSYTITGLTAETDYTIKVEAYDEAGNAGTDTKQTTTQVAGIPENTSYVGYYADVDGNGSVDGVIYADLAIGGSGQWENSNGTYTIPKGSNFKKYGISQKNYTDDFGTKDVIKVTNASGNGRFYVMALNDVDSAELCWYYSASGWMNDFASTTSTLFGRGKQNTKNMIVKWNASGYGSQNGSISYQDVWGLSEVQSKINGSPEWYVPSKEEWSAFGEELGITKNNYGSKGLRLRYWSSSQYNESSIWYAYIRYGYMDYDHADSYTYTFVRLGTTF